MSIYDTLNPAQREAVFCTDGPLLVLAGAGSGKTRVLTHRVAYLIEEKGVNPWNIMAITFTNKAAGEMRERVDKLVSFGAESVWVSTFHSSCVRILRRHIETLGYSGNFTIYDSDDQKTLMKQVLKKLDVDTKLYKERAMLNHISSAKDQLVTPEEMELNAGTEMRQKKIAQIYKAYQEELKKNNALDFDDLIVKTVELFQNNGDILDYYQERFRYIMVDEYQDTNYAQFKLVSLLAKKYRNLCVVGDDDQSIYKFRGADVRNILDFEEAFPGAKVIKLEQNYRSTQNILNAANQVIRHNRDRKNKTLWTANGEGSLVKVRQYNTADEEAEAIAKSVKDTGRSWKEMAVLYRTNAQSRLLEERCIAHNIPYRLVGGVNFYQRKEIKDILAYLKTISNGVDDLAVLRIINVPKRGIGATTIGRVTAFASEHGLSIYDALEEAGMVPNIGKAAGKIEAFTKQIEELRRLMTEEGYTIKELIGAIMEDTGYRKELEAEGEVESETRLENIEELINKAVSYEKDSENPTLAEFLEEVALVADIDRMDDSEERVTLMTLHSAKGLEFPLVYLAGMEDGLFPGMMSISSDDKSELEEERRLCYVGITRAKEELVMTGARMRMVNGETRYSKASRFIEEIPEEYLDKELLEPKITQWESRQDDFDDSGLPWGAGVSKSWDKEENHVWGADSSNSRSREESGLRGWGRSGGTLGGGFGGGFSAGSYNAYASKTSSPSTVPGFGKSFTVEKAAALDYVEGDRVRHIKFGEGTVTAIRDGGKDFEVTVQFDSAGVKKMFASFAKLKKL